MGGHTVSISISNIKASASASASVTVFTSALVVIPKSLWSTQVGQHPSGQHGSVQHSMNMLYMDSLQRGDQCSPGEKVGKPTKV